MPRNIPLHFEALLETIEGAVILAQSVYFQTLVGDAQIIAATPEAARLYGFNHPSELEGKFTSQLDHPDDYQAIKVMAVIRILGLSPTPTEYDVRIVLPDDSIRYIRKEVRQMNHDGNTYWMTKSFQVSPEESKPLPDLRNLLTEEAIQYWFSMISIAELEQLVHGYVPVRNRQLFPKSLTSDEFHHIIDEIHKGGQVAQATRRTQVLPSALAEEVIEIGLGRTRRLPDNRFIHRCGNCAETWASHIRNPQKCPRSRADNRGPKCGTNRWRLTTDRGLECARHQASELNRAPR